MIKSSIEFKNPNVKLFSVFFISNALFKILSEPNEVFEPNAESEEALMEEVEEVEIAIGTWSGPNGCIGLILRTPFW